MTDEERIKKLKRYFNQHRHRLFVWLPLKSSPTYFRFTEIKGSDVKIRQLSLYYNGKVHRFSSNAFPVKYFYEEWIQKRIRRTTALIFLDE